MKITPVIQSGILYILLASVIIISATSCSRKKLPPKSIIPTADLVRDFVKPHKVDQFNAKIKVKVSSYDDSQKATMFVRAKKDSVIWIAIKKLSVEGARILISKDSIFVIDRMDKSYRIIPLLELQKKYGLKPDFAYLYDMLLGTTPAIDSSMHWQLAATTNQLSIETLIEGMLNKFVIDRYSGHVVSGRFMDSRNISGSYQYENYQLLSDSISLPFNRNYEVLLPEGQKVSATLEFSDLELNIENTINFSIPDHYTRIQ